jgi:peroxiredoxin
MYRKFLFLLVIALAVSCSTEKEKGNVSISGSLKAYSGKWLFIDELEVKGRKAIDSVKIEENGTFHMSFDILEAGFFILETEERENYLLLLLEKGEVVTIISENQLLTGLAEFNGSPGSELLIGFEKFMKYQKNRVDSLSEVFAAAANDTNFYEVKLRLDSVYETILQEQKEYVKYFINQHSNSLASLIVINRRMGNTKVLDEEEDFIYFHRLDSVLYPLYPDNKHALDHHQRVEKIRGENFEHFFNDQKLEPGNKAPNLAMKDTTGQFISIRDLGGQNLLICFWAGWNAKSRADNKKLLKEYEHWKKMGIEIFSISMDEHPKVWKGAIKLDQLPWPQGSDLLGKKSPAFKKYNLREELPYYFMLDENGVILFKSDKFEEIKKLIDDLLC